MRILIIGTGSIGRRHLQNIAVLEPETRFSFYRPRGQIDDLSQKYKAVIFDDLYKALENADAAIIANPSNLHKDVLLPLLQKNIPFYVEKPVVTQLEDIELIKDQIKLTNFTAPTIVGCNLRFFSCLHIFRSLILDGAIGNVVRAHFECGKWLPDWRKGIDYTESYSAKSHLGGGAVLDLIHEIDIAHWIFGELEIKGAFCGKFSSLQIESEDTATFLVSCKNNRPPVITINLDYVSRQLVRHYEIVGDLGTLIWDFPKREILLKTTDKVEKIPSNYEDFNLDLTYANAMNEFLTSIKKKRQTSYPIDEGLKITEFALLLKERGQE